MLCLLVPAALIVAFGVDIRNLAKLRKLKQYAVNADVSGLVKVSDPHSTAMKDKAEHCAQRGRPGVLVFQGTRYAIKDFLENARSMSISTFEKAVHNSGLQVYVTLISTMLIPFHLIPHCASQIPDQAYTRLKI